MMTATATSKTIQILKEQFPEVKKWTNILNSPLRENVTLIVPPPSILPSRIEALLEPFMKLIKEYGKVFLVLVRGKFPQGYL